MSTNLKPESVLRPGEAAAYLGVAYNTLAKWALEGKGPRYIEHHNGHRRYRVADLEAYLTANTRGGAA